MKNTGAVYRELPGLIYPFFSSSSRNSFSIFVSFEFKGYILQLILVGAPSNNSIAISS